MQLLYNSDSYTVVQFDLPAIDEAPASRGGYEIVDKFARKDIYLHGAVADRFQQGVMALVEAGPNEEALDDFIAGYTLLAYQPLAMH